MRIWKPVFLWYLGGMLYCGLELVWRGRTHGSMFLVGGLCFLLLGAVERSFPETGLWKRMVLGSAMVTVMELWSGLILNRWLRLGVWDYSGVPLNLLGQICLPYSLLWMPVCGAGMFLYRHLHRALPE